MPNEFTDLRETLARLHEQLRGAADVNPETCALLHGVMRDIHALLNAPPAAESEGARRQFAFAMMSRSPSDWQRPSGNSRPRTLRWPASWAA